MIAPIPLPEATLARAGAQVWLVSERRKVKAADIDGVALIRLVDRIGRPLGGMRWAQCWDIAPHYPTTPYRVVHAKLTRLLNVGLLDGCPCGCRGDWVPTTAGYQLIGVKL